jgi:glycosyltransferase involved in cell wall biosynthesis
VRLLVYSETAVLGGAEVALGNLLAELAPAVDVTDMGTDRTVVEWLAARRPGVATVVVEPVTGKVDARRFLALRRAIGRCAPDVFQANLSTPISCRYALLAAISLRIPTVVVEHSPVHGARGLALAVKGAMSRRFAAHVAVGRSLAAYIETLPLVRPGSVQVRPLGIIDDDVVPAALPYPRPVLGTVARLVPGKRLDVLLAAAARLPDVSVVIVGDGPASEPLRSLADELGIGARVHVLGWRDDAREITAALDVFVLPSEAEGVPMTILEAMRAGVPVVASDVGSVRDAIDDGETGVLVPVGDAGALADAIAALLADDERRARLVASARERVRSSFSSASAARWFESVYAGISDR